MITENNVIESIKDSVNLADVSPENFESTVQFIHRQYEIILKAKDKEIEKCYKEIFHLKKMLESLAKEPIVINLENKKNVESLQEIEHLSSTEISPIKYEIPDLVNLASKYEIPDLINLASVVNTLSFAEKEALRNVLATLNQP
jgi:regulator of replication initiation timing